MPRTRGGHRGGYRGGSNSQPRQPRLTHFLCIPLVTDSSRAQLEDALARFKDLVTDANQSARAPAVVPLTAIRPLDSIHLTLGVMRLDSEEKIRGATAFLNNLDLAKILLDAGNSVSGLDSTALTSKLEVSLESLESMHDVLDTSVLYVNPTDRTNRLRPFCESLRNTFTENGFLVEDNRPLKLHATVVNTIYAKAEVGTVKRLDATELLETFKDFQWVPHLQLENVAICRMGAKKTFDADGRLVKEAYEEIASSPMR